MDLKSLVFPNSILLRFTLQNYFPWENKISKIISQTYMCYRLFIKKSIKNNYFAPLGKVT